jgi:hypothetical protein
MNDAELTLLRQFFPLEVDEPDNLLRDRKVIWEQWTRCAMGLRMSPYQAVQGTMWAMETIFGDQNDETNVFGWRHIPLIGPEFCLFGPLSFAEPSYNPSSWLLFLFFFPPNASVPVLGLPPLLLSASLVASFGQSFLLPRRFALTVLPRSSQSSLPPTLTI